MSSMTVTEFAKNIKKTLDRLEFGGEEIVLIRNNHKIAKIIPGSPHLTALEAMSDLYCTLTPDAGEEWLKESRMKANLKKEIRNPWDS